MTVGEALSIVSSVVSFFLGGFSVWLALYFYTQAKTTEKDVTNALAKIEAQTTALQKLNAKWMDRLTVYVTQERPTVTENSLIQIATLLADIPQTITARMSQPNENNDTPGLIRELISSYIALYHYTALTNFWCQFYLPNPEDYDSANSFHAHTKRVIDGSDTDFMHIASILTNADPRLISENPLVNLLTSTRDEWKDSVMSTSDIYIQRARNKGST